MRSASFVAGLFLLSCKPSPRHEASLAADTSAATTIAASGAAASVEAVSPAAPSAEGGVTLDGGARTTQVNLLDVVPAKLAVSSTVENPRDFPEFIADGKLETAWNGKTGDLVSGYIAFRVPRDAFVDHVEITAGYDRVKGAIDLFTANHRITRVMVVRDGVPLGERTLDPAKRGLQSIPLGAAGGDFELRVLQTLPGTKREWRELVVSELRVMGTPGQERRASNEPLRVAVGGLDKEPFELVVYPEEPVKKAFPTIAALCADYIQSTNTRRAELEETARDHALTLQPPSCREGRTNVSLVGNAVYKSVRVVDRGDGISTSSVLVLERAQGFSFTPATFGWDSPLDPGCPSSVRMDGIASPRIESGYFVVTMLGNRGGYRADGSYYPMSVKGAVWCKDLGPELTCTSYSPQIMPSLEGPFAIAPDGTLRVQFEVAP